VACLAGSPLAQRLEAMALSPLLLPGNKTDPRLASSLAQAARTGNFNLVDAHNVQSYIWSLAALAGRKGRPALAATVHSSPKLEFRNRIKRYSYEGVERLCLPYFDQVVVVSHFLQVELGRWGIPAGRISVSPNGVMLSRLGKATGAVVRHELGLQPDDLVVGSVGRLEPAKGHSYLLHAVARLSQRWPGLQCVLVGEGRLLTELKQLATQLGLAGRVIFTGFRTDVMRLMEAFDVFALPSLTEGIPFALLEACASARPIVASRVGGVPEVIRDGHSGCLTDPADPAQLAAAIDSLLDNPSGAQRLGQQAALDVGRDFSMAHMVDAACEAYDAALRQREARR
jgi:glycosyltransferase involved in cell wall biosynthesis